MRHPLGDNLDLDGDHDRDAHELGADAAAFLEAVLEHEMSLRPRIRCVVTGPARSARRSAAVRARARARLRSKRSGLRARPS